MRLPKVLQGDAVANRVVPPSGFTAALTLFSAAAMAFLAVFSMALAFAAGDLAERWEAELAGTATVRITALPETLEAEVSAVLNALSQTPGIADARRLGTEEQLELLAPWFGSGLPVEQLRLPVLIEVTETGDGPDRTGLEQRLAGEAPGAVYESHGRWRAPLVEASQRLRSLSLVALVLIALVTGVMIALAAASALAANAQVVDVLRLVGAKDGWISRAFVLRFTGRAFAGAILGTLIAVVAVALLPGGPEAGILSGLGFQGGEWVMPVLVPVAAAIIAAGATFLATQRSLRGAA